MLLFVEPNSNVLHIKYTAYAPPNFTAAMDTHIETLIRTHGKFFICVDLKGLNISALVKQQEWLSQVATTSSVNQYSAYLEEIHIHNASLIAKQVMGLLKRIIRKDVVDKIRFVARHGMAEE